MLLQIYRNFSLSQPLFFISLNINDMGVLFKCAHHIKALLKMWCGIRINVRYYHCVILTQIAHL